MRPIVTLSNGIRVINFSSGHDFNFDDGSVLPAVPEAEVKRLSLTPVERETKRKTWTDIDLTYEMSDVIRREIVDIIMWWDLENAFDICLVPEPVCRALTESGFNLNATPFRGIRMKERAVDGKPPIIYSDKFCV